MSESVTVIQPNHNWLSFRWGEVWRYRDLLWVFVKRDIVVVYKQTIFGPLWYVMQPILTTLMFTFVFGKLAQLPTDGLPPLLFYLSGVTLWGYFSDCITRTSNTFVVNQGIFGKVYFPRVIMPLALTISALGKLIIQMLLFLAVWAVYLSKGTIEPNYIYMIGIPFVVAVLGVISLGLGMLFSALTTKYRDLTFLLNFGVQLLMYVTPVIYPLSAVPTNYVTYIQWNPIVPLIEYMRFAFLGRGQVELSGLVYSLMFAITIFCIGYLVFSKVEKDFMDTV